MVAKNSWDCSVFCINVPVVTCLGCRLCTDLCIRNYRNAKAKLLSLLVHYHHIMKLSIDDLSHVLRQP